MSLIAHGAAGFINTWGFAYVGGIIGLFSVSLLYVKGKVVDRENGARKSWLAALGPSVIAVGGVCGVSLGLGIAVVLDRVIVDDVAVAEVVSELCLRSRDSAPVEDSELHDDLDHAIHDLNAALAAGAHRDLHAGGQSGSERAVLVDRLVNELTAADGEQINSCDDLVAGRSDS